MGIRHYTKLFMILVLLSILNESADAVTTKASDELLHDLIKKNSEARKKISSASYCVESHSEQETKEGKRIDDGHGLVKLKGICRWSTFENVAQISETKWKQNQSSRIILNDNYLGYWPSIGSAYAYRADYNSVDLMTNRNKTMVEGHCPPDYQLLNMCFQGFETSSFSEQMKLHPDAIRWEAIKKKKAKEDVYEIRRFSPYMHDRSKADAIWTINKDKGFLVTERISFTKDGRISEHNKIEVKELLPNIWFPISYLETRFKYESGQKETLGGLAPENWSTFSERFPVKSSEY